MATRSWLAVGLRAVAGIVGVALILYALSLVLLGSEDVGGPSIAVPVAAGLILVGVAALVFALRARRD